MGIASRKLEKGNPADFNGTPSPGHYNIQETKNTISNGKLFNDQQRFGNANRDIDISKF